MRCEKKTIILGGILLMTTALTGLSGCMSPAEKKERAAEALQQKYQEEFEIISVKDAGLLTDYYTVEAYSVEYPELIFKASIGEESESVMDSYVTKRVCDRMSDKISQNLATLETDYYVFTEAMFADTVTQDPNATLEEYMSDGPGNRFTVYVCINEKNAEIQNLSEALSNTMNGFSGIRGNVCIYLTDSELLAKIQEYTASSDHIYDDFEEMTGDCLIGTVNFDNKKISLTESELKKMAGDRL